MRIIELAHNKIDVIYLMIACGLCMIVGYLLGKKRKQKSLQSALRHTENHRNELHVQCLTLGELIDNQELDIQRYAKELQKGIERENALFLENQEIKRQAEASKIKQSYSPKAIQIPEQVVVILQEELHLVSREKEALAAKLASTEQVLQFLMKKQQDQVQDQNH